MKPIYELTTGEHTLVVGVIGDDNSHFCVRAGYKGAMTAVELNINQLDDLCAALTNYIHSALLEAEARACRKLDELYGRQQKTHVAGWLGIYKDGSCTQIMYATKAQAQCISGKAIPVEIDESKAE